MALSPSCSSQKVAFNMKYFALKELSECNLYVLVCKVRNGGVANVRSRISNNKQQRRTFSLHKMSMPIVWISAVMLLVEPVEATSHIFPPSMQFAAIRCQGADVNDSSTHVIHDCAESSSHLGSEPASQVVDPFCCGSLSYGEHLR